MSTVKQALEYPLPVLSIGIKELEIEAKNDHEVNFQIKNSGGGALEGQIISPTKSLVFKPDKWDGKGANKMQITCRFIPDPSEGWKPGDVRRFSALIVSNGGSQPLPIVVRLAKMSIGTKEDTTIANLQDFYNYANQYPKEAQELFVNNEFYQLLVATGFPYIDAYQLLVKEENSARAMDNFFILADLKKQTSISIAEPEIEHRTLENGMIHAYFEVQKSDKGYVEATVALGKEFKWLSLKTDKLIFDEDNKAQVEYAIDPMLISGRYARGKIIIQTDTKTLESNIVFKRPVPFLARLPREGFTYNDEGVVVVENQTKETMQVQIFCKENFIRFYEREYKVDGSLEIPFLIKLSPLQSAQMLFRKVPALTADIEIKSDYKGKTVSKKLTLVAGEW